MFGKCSCCRPFSSLPSSVFTGCSLHAGGLGGGVHHGKGQIPQLGTHSNPHPPGPGPGPPHSLGTEVARPSSPCQGSCGAGVWCGVPGFQHIFDIKTLWSHRYMLVWAQAGAVP